jgi:inosose dehydratase
MPISFHHHMGTAVETERELDLLMNYTGEAVHLLFDTGHMTFAGGNSINVINRYAKRISHVHTKDIRSSIVDNLNKDKESFLDAVLKGAFTVPGDGNINFKEVVETLAKHNYEGWFIVEAEQDPAKANPFEMAKIGNKELRECLNLSGYDIEEYQNE